MEAKSLILDQRKWSQVLQNAFLYKASPSKIDWLKSMAAMRDQKKV